MNKKSKIIRTWKGWTSLENASAYEDLLVNEVFPSVKRTELMDLKKLVFLQKTKLMK